REAGATFAPGCEAGVVVAPRDSARRILERSGRDLREARQDRLVELAPDQLVRPRLRLARRERAGEARADADGSCPKLRREMRRTVEGRQIPVARIRLDRSASRDEAFEQPPRDRLGRARV